MEEQTSASVLLCRPARFGFNPEAAQSNAFAANQGRDVADLGRAEFDGLVRKLKGAGVTCMVLADDPGAPCPDAVFPNNWVSLHGDGTMVLYPLANASRRSERRPAEVKQLMAEHGFAVDRVVDLTTLEGDAHFLEGTGSLILDRPAAIAFASRSERTHDAAVRAFDAAMDYRTCLFDAVDRHGRAIYHTNVLLSLGRRFAVLCGEAVASADRQRVREAIESGERTIIDVNYEQMGRFACNIIELKAVNGEPLIAMSRTARDALTADQRRQLEQLGGELVAADIPTIEGAGGGSVRCMIADVHLPPAR